MYFARDENLKSKQKQSHICDKVLKSIKANFTFFSRSEKLIQQ